MSCLFRFGVVFTPAFSVLGPVRPWSLVAVSGSDLREIGPASILARSTNSLFFVLFDASWIPIRCLSVAYPPDSIAGVSRVLRTFSEGRRTCYTPFIYPRQDESVEINRCKCVFRVYIYSYLAVVPPHPFPLQFRPHKRHPSTRTLNRLMKHSSRGGRGAHHGRHNSSHSTPNSQPRSQGGGSNTHTTRSRSISQNPARPDVLVISGPPTQSTLPPLPANNLPVWHRNWIQQILYVPARSRGDFTPADPVPFSVNGIPGISLSHAIAGQYTGLAGAYDRISSFGSSKAIFRIQVGTAILRIIISPTLSPVRWVASVRIHGKKSSQRPRLVLLKRSLGKHSTPQCRMGAHHALETGEGGWEEGKGLHRGEVSPGHHGSIAKECNRAQEQGMQDTLILDKIYLTHLIHVSKGSWQPELWYEDLVSFPSLSA